MSDEDDRLQQALDELYAVDLEDFVARRGELAKTAKRAKDPDAAKAIGALRKPTLAAFTINRLARTDPDAIAGLVAVGSDLRRAQRSADARQLRELTTRRKKLLDALISRAFEVIGQQSPSSAQREEVTATLQAALADPDVAALLQQGILVRAAEPEGFGFSAPELSVVRGGRPADAAAGRLDDAGTDEVSTDDAAAQDGAAAGVTGRNDGPPEPDQAADRKAPAPSEKELQAEREAERERRRAETLAAARAAADEADRAVHEAVSGIEETEKLIRSLQHHLADAKQRLGDLQRDAKAAEERQRKARQALHKAGG